MLRRAVLIGALALLPLTPGAFADPAPAATPQEEVLARYPWPEALKEVLAKPPFAGHANLIDAPAGSPGEVTGKILEISANPTEPLRLRLLTVPNPPVTADFYALAGQVKYEGVQGHALLDSGYLEMWNTFPAAMQGGQQRSFFSRTLGDTAGDPMQSFRGTSPWRPVLLPFNSAGAGAKPMTLTVDLVLPAGGTVSLAPLRLAQYRYGSGQPLAPAAANASWRPDWKFLAAGAAAFLSAIVGIAAWRATRQRRAAEWRRMAAHDVSPR